MTTNSPSKTVAAWFIMKVAEQQIISQHLALISGTIVQSNFLESQQSLQVPSLAAGLEGVKDGDTVKMVYFTTRGELDDFLSGDESGFTDSGLRYLKQTVDGWDLIYEDFDSKP